MKETHFLPFFCACRHPTNCQGRRAKNRWVSGSGNESLVSKCGTKCTCLSCACESMSERPNTHAAGVGVLPLSERRGEPGKSCPFLGSKCRNGAVLRPKTGKFCGAPRRVFRAEKHPRRRRECFAALKTSRGARQNLPVFGVNMPKRGCFAPENGQILRCPPPRF